MKVTQNCWRSFASARISRTNKPFAPFVGHADRAPIGKHLEAKKNQDQLDILSERDEVPTKEAHPSRERDETEQVKALRIVQKELMRLGWTKAELRRRRKGDETKIALARRLREETAVSLRWIAENLYMGTWTHVSNRLYHCR